jgi:hypothetical protein
MSNPYDLLPQPVVEDTNDPISLYRWLYRLWLKLRNSYNSQNDMGVFMNTLGISKISNIPEPSIPSSDPTVFTMMNVNSFGDIGKETEGSKAIKMINMNSADLNEIKKIKRDVETLILMGMGG